MDLNRYENREIVSPIVGEGEPSELLIGDSITIRFFLDLNTGIVSFQPPTF
jgi:hypothetical protein